MRTTTGGKQIVLSLLAISLATSLIVITEVRANSVGPVKSEDNVKEVAPSAQLAPKVAASESPKVAVEAKSAAAAEAPKATESESEANARKGRSEAPSDKKEASTEKPAAADANKDNKVNSNENTKSSPSTSSKPASQEKSQPSKQSAPATNKQQAANKSSSGSSGKSKLPANLGTVTSTGSGGPAHYMSKHDAYSAIAEKHGALAHDAMRKSDKRRIQSSFGGIQKASGIGDMLTPFKGVTDSGLARTLGASMRSIIKGKYSVPAYVASALLGAVALMAFYESPISPLPVPPLPEPPVGRFPPEMPSLPPGIQVPFRGNQQQQQQQQQQQAQYGQQYQRSFQTSGPQQQQFSSPLQQQQQQQQPQQVLFPGQSQVAQQRQMNAAGPVQQLAANLLSSVGGKQQSAQRKSAIDYDLSSSRSLFGSGATTNANSKLSSPANSQQQSKHSFLSYFGLASAGSPTAGSEIQQASGLQQQISNSLSGMGPLAAAAMSAIEPKGQSANGLSNSHVVNKVKSYFTRPASTGSSSSSSSSLSGSSSSSSSSSSPYDQYQKMSFVQALMKDTAFLPAFLNPTRKSSSSPPSSSSSGSSSSSSPSSAPSTATSQPAAARMQTDGQPLVSQPQVTSPIKRASTGFGFNRIAHALLDTFTAGIMQRSPVGSPQQVDRKSSVANVDQSPLLSATTLLTDIMTNYKSQVSSQNGQQLDQTDAGKQQVQYQSPGQQQQPQSQADIAGGRAIDAPPMSQPAGDQSANDQNKSQHQQQPQAAPASSTKSSQSSAVQQPQESSQQQPQQAHVRKTRSIGFEYPVESNQALALRDNQQQLPSKAAQINNLVDYVADSYSQNRLLFNFVMNQVGLSHAVPYVEQILGPTKTSQDQFQ